MIRFHVQAVSRQGFKGCSRAGRFWPSGEAVEIVVHDQDADPEDALTAEGKSTRHTEAPRRLGKISFEALKSDGRLRIINAGDPMAVETDQVANLRARFDQAWGDLKRTHAEELLRIEERHAEEITHLRGLLAQWSKDHGAEKARADEAEAEAMKLMDELEAARGGVGASEPTLRTPHADIPEGGRVEDLEGETTKVETPKKSGGKKGKGGSAD